MLEKLKEIVVKVAPGTDVSNVTEQTNLVEDLGFDSLALMMMAMEIEDAFDITFTEFVMFTNVGDVCNYIKGKI